MENRGIFDTDRLIPTYFKLSLPVVFSMVITLIYNLADTYFIGRTNDAMLVAGVSLCSPLFMALQDGGILADDHEGGCVLYEKREQVEALLAQR